MFTVKKLPRQRPLGLVHLRWMFVPVYLDCHELVLIRVHMPQQHFSLTFAEAAYCVDLIRAQIPNVDGLKWI